MGVLDVATVAVMWGAGRPACEVPFEEGVMRCIMVGERV
jgi:hypothetical protein